MKNGIIWLQTAPLISCIWLLTACTMEDIPVKPDDSVSDDVRLTQIYTEVYYPSTGMLVTSTTVDLVWENGLLKNQNSTTYSPLTGKTTDLGENTYVYNGNDCIEKHYISPNQNVNEYFTYANGRMTSAVKMSGDDITDRVTIHSYTDDGHVKTMTIENIKNGKTTDYEFTWENGDMTSYRMHPVEPAGEDVIISATYDNYPNIHTGKPLADYIFDPGEMAIRGSKHNCLSDYDEFIYDNGRLVIKKKDVLVAYHTFSDGTIGIK